MLYKCTLNSRLILVARAIARVLSCAVKATAYFICLVQWNEKSNRNQYYNTLAAAQAQKHKEFVKAEEKAYAEWKKSGGAAATEKALGPAIVESIKQEAAALIKVCLFYVLARLLCSPFTLCGS